MKDTIRTFIAFELPEHVIQLADDLQQRLRYHDLKLSWVRPRNIHLTIKFLGEVSEAGIPDVVTALRSTSRVASPMDLTAQGLGVFPGLRKPRVLWFGLGGQVDLLAQVHSRLENELAAKGFAKEPRPFRAHLTLARIKNEVDARNLLEIIQDVGGYDPVDFRLTDWVLFKSDLRPQGAVYTPLERVALGGGVNPY